MQSILENIRANWKYLESPNNVIRAVSVRGCLWIFNKLHKLNFIPGFIMIIQVSGFLCIISLKISCSKVKVSYINTYRYNHKYIHINNVDILYTAYLLFWIPWDNRFTVSEGKQHTISLLLNKVVRLFSVSSTLLQCCRLYVFYNKLLNS